MIDDTIVAIASPTGVAIRGIVRLSGTDCLDVLDRFSEATADSISRRQPRVIHTAEPFGDVDADVLIWSDQRSYTGQPSVEIHTHGCTPLLQAIIDAALIAGARAAKPGEFTMRAFLAGRLDLTQAEAVLGVIDAEDRGSLDHALLQLAGNLSRPLEQLRGELLDLLADLEAGLDFVDEDIEFISDETLGMQLQRIAEQLRQTMTKLRTRGGGRDRATVVFVGLPNAGKSRLMNALSGSDAAIVADVAGTTRDAVVFDTELGGRAVRLTDTAGFETIESSIDSDTVIADEAQRQTNQAIAAADLCVHCVDLSDGRFATGDTELITGKRRGTPTIVVGTKADLIDIERFPVGHPTLTTSSLDGRGIDRLRHMIADQVGNRDAGDTGSVIGTAARCQDSLRQANDAVNRALQLLSDDAGHEIVASELRLAVAGLGEVTGAVYTDDVLDRVFGRFCIGK